MRTCASLPTEADKVLDWAEANKASVNADKLRGGVF